MTIADVANDLLILFDGDKQKTALFIRGWTSESKPYRNALVTAVYAT